MICERVGHQLVEGKVVSSEDLAQALAIQQDEGGPLGSILVGMGVLSESMGSLDTMLEKIADLFVHEVDRVVATLTSVLEPCVIVVVGSGIALVVVAMYLPIFSIGSIIG